MPLASGISLGHGQDRTHITGDSRFRHPKGASQPGSDAIAKPLTREVLGDPLAPQTGVKAAHGMILTPSICALTNLCPTCICTPNVWHLSYRFCVSVNLMRDVLRYDDQYLSIDHGL
jgi:hypothetical protein